MTVLLGVLLAACSSSPPAGSRLPGPILAELESRYPGQRIVFAETRVRGDGHLHAVILDRDGLRTVVHLDENGTLLWERAEIPSVEVPHAILGSIRTEFPDAEIPLAIRLRDGERITYELRLLDPSGIMSRRELPPAGMIVEDINGEGVPGPAPEDD